MNNATNRERIIKSGWLKKQGGVVRTWHRRWFVLNGDCLFYFAKDDDIRPLGTIFLPGNRVTEHPYNADEPDKIMFEIIQGKSQSKMAPNHESFLIWASSEDERKDWIQAMRKVMYAPIGGAIFGQALEETMRVEHKRNRRLPYIIEECVEFLYRNDGLEIEGIFRLAGRAMLVRQYKESFDCGERVKFDISDIDCHTVASLLKNYLRELPESIIPCKQYQKFMHFALLYQGKKTALVEILPKLSEAVVALPEDNYHILNYICKLLYEVGSMSDINKMTMLNLSTVFGPNIIRHMDNNPELFMATADLTQELTFLLINYYKDIFVKDVKSKLVVVDNLLDLNGDADSDTPIMRPKPAPRKEKIRSDLRSLDLAMSEAGDSKLSRSFSSPDGHRPMPWNSSGKSSTLGHNMSLKKVSEIDLNSQEPPIAPKRKSRQNRSAESSPVHSENIVTPTGIRATPYLDNLTKELNKREAAAVLAKSPSVEKEGVSPRRTQVAAQNGVDAATPMRSQTLNPIVNSKLEPGMDELKIQVRCLKDELTASKAMSVTLKEQLVAITDKCEKHIDNVEFRHKKQFQEIVKKLEKEKTARSEAVDRIVLLQAQLHAFQMKFGEID